MPVHKRSLSVNATDEDSVRRRHQHHRAKQSKLEDQELEQTSEEEEEEEETEQTQKNRIAGGDSHDEAEEEEEEEGEGEDSEGSPSSSSGDKPEYVYVDLAEVRKEVQCPICLGIIKKTRTVMECLHRFCRECIDKSMRMGNNECPACRTHCASRRSLRDDPNFDALIAVLYPNIDKYEEEELAFHAEEKARNKQIQESIAEIVQRQSEACSKRRNSGKDPVTGLMPRSQRNGRTPIITRRKRKTREAQESDENEDENGNFGGAKDSSSGDELIAQVRPRKQRKKTPARSSLPSSSSVENDADVANRGISPAINTEMFGWGRGGTRSNTRHGASNSSGKVSRNTRIAKLVEHLRHIEEQSNNEMDVHFMLVPLDKESMPSLKLPHICSRPSLSVGNLRQYIAQQTHLQAQEVEILLVKSQSIIANNSSQYELVFPDIDSSATETCQLEEEDTLARIRDYYLPTMTSRHLVLGYRQKPTMMATTAP